MRCTHGCSHYNPDGDINHRCDIHSWSWQILDRDNCEHFDGKPYKEKEPKPKKIKQPQGAWQTGLAIYQGFPYCCQSFQDHPKSHVDIGDDVEPIVAFNCDYFPTSKGTSEECLGMGCPFCKLVQINEYNKHMKGTQ